MESQNLEMYFNVYSSFEELNLGQIHIKYIGEHMFIDKLS